MNTIIEKIRAEVNKLPEEYKGLYKQFGNSLGFIDGLDMVKKILSDLEKEENPVNPEVAMKELDEKIALVKQRRTWDGVDVCKYMDEVRGREPEKPSEGLEEEISRYLREDCSKGQPGIREVVRHFAKWGAEHAKECDEKPNKVKADFDIYRFQKKFCIHCEIPHCTGTIDYLKSCPYLNK